MVDLVGRPSYGAYDPTTLMMFTFPMIFGAILGDWGFGLVIVALAMFLRSKPMAADPVVKNGITILLWMGIWCVLWGFYFAKVSASCGTITRGSPTNSPTAIPRLASCTPTSLLSCFQTTSVRSSA